MGVTVIADVLADAGARMDRAVEAAKDDFATVRTGRANPQLFQKILVDYYGTPTPLAQLASLNNPEARTLVVTPYDKSALKAIEQAIRDTPNLGANPTNDGNLVRVTLPELTEERRKRVRQARARARARTRRCTCAASVASPRTTSTASRATSAKTSSPAPRRSSTR